MPQIVREDLWTRVDMPVVYLVTTNAVINKAGELVMGRGAALQAKSKIPGIARECAITVKELGGVYGLGIVRVPTKEKAGFGIFQVKYAWHEPANLRLIEKSVARLCEWCADHPFTKVRMNYPGIGNGKLKREDVEPLLAPLPDTVTVCYR